MVTSSRPSNHSEKASTEIPLQSTGQVQIEEIPKEFKHSVRILSVSMCLRTPNVPSVPTLTRTPATILAFLAFMAAIDGTILTTSLPTITRDVGGASLYAWIANSYLFVSTVPQPFFAQIANVFGRKNPMLASLFLFALGSGIGGGANGPAMLIAGRVVQGLGSAGLYVLPEILICDMVPPRFWAMYLSSVLSCAALGSTIGPVVGGAIVAADWRWIFWINLPIAGAGFIAIVLLLDVRYTRSPTWVSALLRIDFLGNAIFIPSMIAIFIGLIGGGVEHPWGAWQTILPLVLGFCGWVVFHVHQSSRWCKEPTMPSRLFKHRTSAAGYLFMFIISTSMQGVLYFLPVYFLAAKLVSPLTSGVYFLPFSLAILPFGGFAGWLLNKFGVYRYLHWIGFALAAIGTGLFALLDESSSTAAWVCFQIIASGGVGIVFTITLPTTLAALEEKDVAVATGTYSFIRTFGMVWGVTIASIVFNGQINTNIGVVGDAATRDLIKDGSAYSFASGELIGSLEAGTRTQVVEVYVRALRVVWYVLAAIAVVGFFTVFLEKHVPLRQAHNSEYGLAEDKNAGADPEGGEDHK